MSDLYHYTCDDHGRRGIKDEGLLLPLRSRVAERAWKSWPLWQTPLLDLVWMTDLDVPMRDALGLTKRSITCDRATHRYRVSDTLGVARWVDQRRNFPAELRALLERQDGVLPAHWWVSYCAPVPVTYDPIGMDGAA